MHIIYNTWKEWLREIAEASLGRESRASVARRQERLTQAAEAKYKAGSLERMLRRRSSLRRAITPPPPPPFPLSMLWIFPESIFHWRNQSKMRNNTPSKFVNFSSFTSTFPILWICSSDFSSQKNKKKRGKEKFVNPRVKSLCPWSHNFA